MHGVFESGGWDEDRTCSRQTIAACEQSKGERMIAASGLPCEPPYTCWRTITPLPARSAIGQKPGRLA